MNNKKFWKNQEKKIIIKKNKMNIIESCLNKHSIIQKNKTALHFENEKGQIKKLSYGELSDKTNQFANFLNKINIKKNSRIFIFLPKCPESYISFLGTIKHGSIATPLFEAFQSEGLKLRLKRGNANALVTNKELLKRLKSKKEFAKMKIILIDSEKHKNKIRKMPTKFKTILKNKKDTATMIFTSSTAGTPVAGIEIPHYGLVQQHFTAETILDIKPNDNYWCTAHPGWVTGSIYGIIAPLSIGCSIYILQGRFDSKKWISFLKNNKISVLYTAPTVLRLWKKNIKKNDFKNLRILASVGEALTKTTFEFYKTKGIQIRDTYWQTETGAIMIANLNGKIGSMGKSIPGLNIKIKNKEITIEKPWPAMMTGIYKHKKMYKNYFSKKWFKTNDLAKKDSDKNFYFEGRHDDIIKTSGERISPIEIESILMKHKTVQDVAIIGIPDKMKGSILKAIIVLHEEAKQSKDLKQKLKLFVKKNYAGHAYPKIIEFVDSLPKTNSGKIIRAKLRKLK